jgi:hypothetical protein
MALKFILAVSTLFLPILANAGGGGITVLSVANPPQNSLPVENLTSSNILVSTEAINALKSANENSSIELSFGNFSKPISVVGLSENGTISVKTTDGSQFQVVEK